MSDTNTNNENKSKNFVLVIHGGAGTIADIEGLTPNHDIKPEYRKALAESLRAGYKVLQEGGEAMDAAVAAVVVMEDNPLFNAGKGAVFNSIGENELEASIMLSKPPSAANYPYLPSSGVADLIIPIPPRVSHDKEAAEPHKEEKVEAKQEENQIPTSRKGVALTLLTRTKNPSKLAKEIYLHPELVPHVLISGEHAETLADQLGLETVDPSYYWTERRWKEHRRGLGLPEDSDVPNTSSSNTITTSNEADIDDMPPKGTVGAVALDIRGCIAAVTSTGGRTNKLPGRVGDTPQMGSGFWAEEWVEDVKRNHDTNVAEGGWVESLLRYIGIGLTPSRTPPAKEKKARALGISGTGDGDAFIRQNTAHLISARVKYLGESLVQASETVIQDMLKLDGLGGLIGLDESGEVTMALNSTGMYRGIIRPDGIPKVAVFWDEEVEEVPL